MRAAAHIQNQVCGVKRKIPNWKYFHGFLTLTDGEYTCEMYAFIMRHLKMRLGRAHSSNGASLSGHMQPFCQHATTPRHRILCAKLPDRDLKFECSVLHSNVDFYFKFDEYSKKKELTALKVTQVCNVKQQNKLLFYS